MVSIAAGGRMDLEEMLSRAEGAMNRANQQRAMEAQRAQAAQNAQGSASGQQQGGQQPGAQQHACKPPVDAAAQAGARQAAIGTEAQRRSSMEGAPVDGAANASRPRRGLSGEGNPVGNPVEAKPEVKAAEKPQANETARAAQDGAERGASETRGADVAREAAAQANRTLRRGDTGDDVKALQRSLNERGARLQEDGVFGAQTDRAVRQFQRGSGLQEDGVVGARTREKMKAAPATTTRTGEESPAGRTGGTQRAGGTQPSGDTSTVQGAAKFLLNSPNVKFWDGLSTGSDRKNMERIARGEQAFVNATGQRVPVNPRMMQALVEMAKRGPIQINALTGGEHSRNSRHYHGDAVDLSVRVGNAREIERIANQYGGRRNHERTHIHLSF